MAAWFALFATHPPARAEDVTILNIILGKPLTIPECVRNQNGGYKILSRDRTCWTRDRYVKDSPGMWLSPKEEAQLQFIRQPIYLELRGKNVDAIKIITNGISVQETAFSTLEDKFGKPTSANVDEVQNRFGATFSVYRAQWTKPGIIVEFEGAYESLDSGRIEIMTKQYKNNRDAARAAAKPKL